MYRLSGVVSAPPSSAAAAVTRVLGWVSSSGLMVRCSVASLTMVHAIAVNCLGRRSIGNRLQRFGVEALDVACVAGCSAAGSPTYSRTTIDDGVRRDRDPLRIAEDSADGGSAAENTSANAAGVELQLGVAEIARHAARRQAGARQHLEPEIGGAAARSGDAVGAVTADHGQQISAVGIGAADHPGVAAHVEETRTFRVGLDGQLRAQRGHLAPRPAALPAVPARPSRRRSPWS